MLMPPVVEYGYFLESPICSSFSNERHSELSKPYFEPLIVTKLRCLLKLEYLTFLSTFPLMGGAVASWLVRSSPDRAFRVGAPAGDIVLCSWARHFTLTVPLSTQEYEWVAANCWGKPNKLLGSDLRWTSIPSRGSRNTPSRFMLQKPG